MIHWYSNNQSLVRRGEILFSYDFLDVWDDDLEKMNKNKKGKKYKFPDSFILIPFSIYALTLLKIFPYILGNLGLAYLY